MTDPNDIVIDPDFEAENAAFTCTCTRTNEILSHDAICELWASWDFDNGWAEWSPERRRLVAAPTIHSLDDLDDLDSLDAMTFAGGTSTTWPKSTTGTVYQKCRHYQQEVVFPEGTTVYASSHSWKREENEVVPDLGIYLDGCWTPDTIAFHVGTPDYGIPKLKPWQVIHVANEGLRMARDGSVVEVGCIGGHGRTGMMLAIMVVVATEGKMTGDEAVAYVRANYCTKAVESKIQEWYVEGIRCEVLGTPWPAEPPKPPPAPPFKVTPTTTTPKANTLFSTSAVQHALRIKEQRDALTKPSRLTKALESWAAGQPTDNAKKASNSVTKIKSACEEKGVKKAKTTKTTKTK